MSTTRISTTKKYLLSIVIPTRNRQQYAADLVRQILGVFGSCDSVQIIITDNSDDDSLRSQLGDLGDREEIKYYYIAKRIPGVDNYAKGIELSDGEYVCCLGDDDAVLPELLEVTRWASNNNIPAVKFGAQASYVWPDTVNGHMSGRLSLNRFSCSVSVVNVENELVSFLQSGCLDLPNAKIPKAYHGIVRRDIFDVILERTGRYCGGLSPDIYLGVSLALLIEKLVCIDLPLTLFGACKQSTTGDSLNKINVGKLEDAPHFVGQKYDWDELVPRYYCGANIWADSALHALTDMGKADLRAYFSVEHISAYGLVECADYSDIVRQHLAAYQCDGKKVRSLVSMMKRKRQIRDFKNKLKENRVVSKLFYSVRSVIRERKNDVRCVVSDIESASDAAQIVHRCISDAMPCLMRELDMKGVNNGRK